MILTQSALKTFLVCKRLFRYRYIDRLAWPEFVPGSEELRKRLERGADFHLMINRFLKGRDVRPGSEELVLSFQRWQELTFPPTAIMLSELEISYPFSREVGGAVRTDVLRARLDLLVLSLSECEVTIWDWKLGTAPKTPSRLQSDPQTTWYLYLTAAVWPTLRTMFPGFEKIEHIEDHLSMTYWFAQPMKHEATQHTIRYSADQFQRDAATVAAAVVEMVDRPYHDYELTENQELCAACQYRTLDERVAGPLQQIEQDVVDLLSWDIDLELDASEDPEEINAGS